MGSDDPDRAGLFMEHLYIMSLMWTNPVERGMVGLVTRYAAARYDWFMMRRAAYHIHDAKLYMHGHLGRRAP